LWDLGQGLTRPRKLAWLPEALSKTQLSQTEIGGDKRIYRHLSEPERPALSAEPSSDDYRSRRTSLSRRALITALTG